MTTQEKEQAKPNITTDVDKLSDLSASINAIDDNSPLSIIRQKEAEFKKYLIKTRAEADKIVENAKKEAEKLKNDIAIKGEEDAQAHFNTQIAKILKEAEEIRKEAPAKAKAAASEGQKNLDKAISKVKNILVPK